MKRRCYDITNVNYRWYGHRGIKICDEWHNFETFYQWAISSGYQENLTIERKNNNGDYCPENCTWIPMCEQSKHKNAPNTYPKVDKLNPNPLPQIEKLPSIRIPKIKTKKPPKLRGKQIVFNGESKNITQWAKDPRCVVSAQTLSQRLKINMPFELALKFPAEYISSFRYDGHGFWGPDAWFIIK